MNFPRKKAKILLVDDEKTYLDVLVDLLEKDYKLIIAKNGEQALKKSIVDYPPDLILLDILMPGADGYEVCRKLKKDSRTKNTPVIFLSALDEVEDKTKGFDAGGVDYITKPFQGKKVLARVETHVKIQELHRRLEEENTRFKTLAEAAFEGIVIHNNGWIIEANSEAKRILGRKANDFSGRNLMDFMPAECLDAVQKEKEKPWKGNIKARNEQLTPVEIRTKRMDMKDYPVHVTAIRDLSAQKLIENENKALQKENRALKDSMGERYKFGDLIGRSPQMQSVYELIARAAASEFHVVIYGESGTGKELAARTIFEMSPRNKKAFVAVNCGAITETIFEREFFGHRKGAFTHAEQDKKGFFDAANDGALFLDELSELKPAMQVKLLRVLENGEYTPVGDTKAKKANVRVISATNKDLFSLVQQGKFREDLFYRIHVIEIVMPPLRERKEDIPLLADYFLSRFSTPGNSGDTKPDYTQSSIIKHCVPGITGKMLDSMYQYEWPGNVRELQNFLQRFLATNQLTLPGEFSMQVEEEPGTCDGNLNKAIETLEHKMINDTLNKTGWHRGKTAEILNIPRRTLQRKMIKYGFRDAD